VAGCGDGTAKTYQNETNVKSYLILHRGFEKPTPEEVAAWNK